MRKVRYESPYICHMITMMITVRFGAKVTSDLHALHRRSGAPTAARVPRFTEKNHVVTSMR